MSTGGMTMPTLDFEEMLDQLDDAIASMEEESASRHQRDSRNLRAHPRPAESVRCARGQISYETP
jgi:hypothetical protein